MSHEPREKWYQWHFSLPLLLLLAFFISGIIQLASWGNAEFELPLLERILGIVILGWLSIEICRCMWRAR